MDPKILRLICDLDCPALTGQGIVWNGSLLAPLHILDESRCLGKRNIVLYQADGRKTIIKRLRMMRSFPAADAAIFRLDCELLPPSPLNFATYAREGDKVSVQWLTFRGGGIYLKAIRSKIREVVTIGRYEYRSASTAILSAESISAIFLCDQMAPGTSGAPVYSDAGKVLGFIHGNAAANNSLAICLDPCSLNRWLVQC